MKKIIHKNLSELLRSKAVLAVSGGLILMSCGTQMGGYSETDGVYYDPSKDTLPEGVVVNEGNRVGEYYDYQDNQSVIGNSKHNEELQKDKYRNWKKGNSTDSDWGAYAGTETNYYNDYWGSPYGFGFSPWGWGSGFSIGFSWGSPWGWYSPYSYYGMYSPYSSWGWYNPYWGYYSPYSYYGYGYGYGGYNPYYGYYSPYYGGYYGNYGYAVPYRRSGSDGRSYNSYGNGGLNRQAPTGNRNSGFRNDNGQYRPVPQQQQNQQNPRGTFRNRSEFPTSTPRQMPDYEPRQQRSYDNGGFRSGGDGGFRSGSSGSSSSGGGFRGGSSSSGSGNRNGGFR